MINRMYGSQAPIKLIWNNCVGEGIVLFEDEYEYLQDVTRLDMLRDFIDSLQQEYEEQIALAFELETE